MTARRPRIKVVLERSDGQVTEIDVPGDFVDDADARDVAEGLAAMHKTIYRVVADAFGVTRAEAKERLVAAMYGKQAARHVGAGTMRFSEAVEALRKGLHVARVGWNARGVHVYLEEHFTYVVRGGALSGLTKEYEPCLVMFTAQGRHQPGWAPSQADVLAEDWFVVGDAGHLPTLRAPVLPAQLNVGSIYGVTGWVRVGRYDSAERRALWIYDPDPDMVPILPNRMARVVVMRAGREGDDAYVELRRSDFPSDEKWIAFEHVVSCALSAARDTKDGGAM